MSDRLVAKTFSQLKKMYKQAEFSIQHGTVCLEPRDIVENMLELEELAIAKQRIAELGQQNKMLSEFVLMTNDSYNIGMVAWQRALAEAMKIVRDTCKEDSND